MRPDEQVALANHLARRIKNGIPSTHGFCLFLFPTRSKPGSGLTTYIANVERADMRHELRLVLAKWDADEIAGAKLTTSARSLGQVAYESSLIHFEASSQAWHQLMPVVQQAWEATAAAVKAAL